MKLILKTLLTLVVFSAAACNSEAGSETSKKMLQTSYTRIDSCRETVDNVNAAFSILDCGKLGEHDLQITVQSPTVFTVHLKNGSSEVMSEFEELSGDLPLETGPTLEWYSDNHQPRLMVFRVRWGTEEAPFQMNERLVISHIGIDRICPLATVDVQSNKNANEKARALIYEKFLSISECPESVLTY
ncbi:hypothetical protein SAMN04487965_1789 [Microbulbifer donghaiensis]|uniref:Lipoprotein n=1 Tax=Microbulbifer donghaiensis TaxID=494016 RepID=A0A1M5A9W6_9GAMM|nr:hypothetical protein [Microbulbifer donghaiensis]SHF26826.1 hypothetical protein SAMN04487965_1789 [Microbulbifer donghaiensis]